MAKSLTIALLAFALAGIAIMAAPSSDEEGASNSPKMPEVEPPEEEEVSEELEEGKTMKPTKDEVCTTVPPFVLHQIKERLGWKHEVAENALVHLFMLLNRNNIEEGRVDFNCMMHLVVGVAGLKNMEEVLSVYAEQDGADFSEVKEGIEELKSRMTDVLHRENPARDSEIEKVVRKYISLGLEMGPPRELLESHKHKEPEPFGPGGPGPVGPPVLP